MSTGGNRVLVIGGGFSGLATAHSIEALAAERGDAPPAITILEAADRVGGKVRTSEADGFTCEWGPAGFLDGQPHTVDLCRTLGLALVPAAEASKNRYLYVRGALRAIEMHPMKFAFSPILSVGAKLRLLGEPLVRRRPADVTDETIAQFARRRLGDESFRTLIDAMQSGIHAGDPERLSVDACFPRVVEVEAEFGSLIKGMVKLMRRRRRGDAVPGAGPSGRLTTVEGGLQQLVDRLAESVKGNVICGTPVQSIARRSNEWRVTTPDGNEHVADLLIGACPAYVMANLMQDVDAVLADDLAGIEYAPMIVACLGFQREAVSHPLDGFGFLAPRDQGLRILGALFSSTIFPGRAPDGHVLVRAMVGGARDKAALDLDDEQLLNVVREELGGAIGIEGPPSFHRIFRHERAIPQYNVGHLARLERIQQHLARLGGLLLTGNAYRGIGINDCSRNARPVAEEALTHLAAA